MDTLLISLASFFGFIVAYNTYGKWIGQRIFGLNAKAHVPSKTQEDGKDYVPTKTEIVFGHHFTSIAGTGPIVGPAIAVFWGWLPALLWVVFGSIFIGAVHDFGSLVVSLRSNGQTIGEVAGRMINHRAKLLFLLILFFGLTVVLGVFGLVIAIIFATYPESVLSVWMEIPLAILLGVFILKKKKSILVPSLVVLATMYALIGVGAYFFPIELSVLLGIPLAGNTYANVVVVWTVILFVYCFIASVLPVWTLLQPRDYINSHELIVALGLIVLGLLVASFSGDAQLLSTAPAIARDIPSDAPPIWPFLFITIACGAISGFHCLVASGTSSKQLESEPAARTVGYGAMLLEGALAVIVIMACVAGVGMGAFERTGTGLEYAYAPVVAEKSSEQVRGHTAWRRLYATTRTKVVDGKEVQVGGWASHSLKHKVGAFIEGGANFLSSLGIPLKFAIGILAVLVASFAATTLDTATRLQRYVIQELSVDLKLPFKNKYSATFLAVVLGLFVALLPGALGPGSGGLLLWPLFGATNQLLAGLAFLVILFYLKRHRKPIWFLILPALMMLVFPTWAFIWQMFNKETGWLIQEQYILFSFGSIILLIQVWMVLEAALLWNKVDGVLPKGGSSSISSDDKAVLERCNC